jgi:hypothetical protein
LTEYTVLIAIKGIEFDAADLMVSTADGWLLFIQSPFNHI